MAKLNLNEINEQIRLINKELGNLDSKKFGAGQIKEATAELNRLRRELNSVNSDIDYFGTSLKNSIQELQKANFALGQSKKSFKSLVGIAEDFGQVLNGQASMTDKEIKKKKALAALEFKRLKHALTYGNLSKEQTAEIENRVAQEQEYMDALQDVIDFQDRINAHSGVKIFGGLEEISNAIPGLKNFTSAFKDASDAAKEVAMNNEVNDRIANDIYEAKLKQRQLDKEALKTGKGLTQEAIERLGLQDKLISKDGEAIQGASAAAKAKKMGLGDADFSKISKSAQKPMNSMMAGIKSLGKSLLKSLGPLYLLKELVDAIKATDKAAASMAKEFGMTYNQALGLNQQMTQIATSSKELFVTTKGVRETFEGINRALGTASMPAEDVLVSFTKLREMSGFTAEELNGIFRILAGTNKEVDDITGQVLAQAEISATQLGVKINEQKVLKELNKVSAATTLSFAKNPKLIAEAVATAQALGLELGKVEGIAEQLLDFESSIENELQAELLLNKDINLEKARQAALNNDLATVAKEISEQVGSSAEFAEMNRIQQDALAKSVGMNREDLAETLLLQEQLSHLTEEDAKAATAKFEKLKAQFGVQEAQRILEQEGVEGLEKQVGAQERFNQTIEKLKEVFVTVANAIMPIIDIVAQVMGAIGSVLSALDPIIQTTLVGVSIITDLVRGITTGFGLWGDFGGFTSTAKQIEATEISTTKNWGAKNLGFTEGGRSANETMMAAGGIVTGPTRAVVGEAGPEAVVPLSDNSPMIKQANETNTLLRELIGKTPEYSPLSLYQVQ